MWLVPRRESKVRTQSKMFRGQAEGASRPVDSELRVRSSAALPVFRISSALQNEQEGKERWHTFRISEAVEKSEFTYRDPKLASIAAPLMIPEAASLRLIAG